jgi:hypothetical protein
LPIERLLLIKLLLPPLYNDRPVKIKASIKLAIGRNKGNKDKVVRRLKREATRRNGRRIILSLTLKIVSRNEVVDLNNLVASAPLYSVRSYLNYRR